MLALFVCVLILCSFALSGSAQSSFYEGSEVATMISFTQTGEETITASACPVPAEKLDSPNELQMISQMWEREE